MRKFIVAKKIILAMLALWLVHALIISGGCKKTDQAEDTRQTAEAPEVEQAAAPEIVENAGVSEKMDLRILYVGLPDTERQKDFVTFLRGHFKQVDTADYNAFGEEQAKDCDVAIFDKDGIERQALDIEVSEQYSRATVTIGLPGALWGRSRNMKTAYM